MGAKKYRIVLDTNVLVSALRSRDGASFKVLSLLRDGTFTIQLSTPLVLEYEMVLKRSDLVKFTAKEIDEFLDILCLIGEHQRLWYLWRPLLPDGDDDFLAELAANSQADFIVTHNTKHFEPLRKFGVRICSPKDFLKLLETQS